MSSSACSPAAYSAENNPADVLMVFVFGALGVAMERFGYNHPALILGFVFGEMIKRYFQVSATAYGAWFLLRPISLTIIARTLFAILWPSRKRLLPRRTPA